jgi:hypothetical protein
MRALHRLLGVAAFAVLVLTSSAAAQVSFSGDARFRPRLDLDDRTGDPGRDYESNQFYYMYRLRLNMTAAIGDGYYVKSRLAHHGVAFYQKGGRGNLPDIFGNDANTVSDESAVRPELDLSYIYIGRATDTFGFDLGIIPVPGYSNPLWDLHYYPNLMIDVPYFIFNTDGSFGGKAYVQAGPGRLTVYALLDRETEESRESGDGETLAERDDQYTLSAAYSLPVAEGFTFEPMIVKTIPASSTTYDGGVATTEDYNAPLTIGANLVFPKFSGLTPSATVGYTTNSEAGTVDSPASEYTGWLGRFKLAGPLGPGSVNAWVDVASRTDELEAADVGNDYLYWWLAYTIPVYSGDHGSFRITPEWRFINIDREDVTGGDDLDLRTRHKIEINFDISFR